MNINEETDDEIEIPCENSKGFYKNHPQQSFLLKIF